MIYLQRVVPEIDAKMNQSVILSRTGENFIQGFIVMSRAEIESLEPPKKLPKPSLFKGLFESKTVPRSGPNPIQF